VVWRRVCNAGFQKHAGGASCVACTAGTHFSLAAASGLKEGQTQPLCQTCGACVAGLTYESGACQTTKDRVCSSCRTSCSVGEYISKQCTVTGNLECSGCVTKCAAEQYMNPGQTNCTGADTVDTVLAGCRACVKPGECGDGEYLSKECTGSETSVNECRGCERADCVHGVTYSGGCGGLEPSRCLSLTQCAAGWYLNRWSDVRDGVCTVCTNCVALGLTTVRECGPLQNAVCGGDACDEGKPCNQTDEGESRFCNYLSGLETPSCGVCPVSFFLLVCVCGAC